jgi:copper transport protein
VLKHRQEKKSAGLLNRISNRFSVLARACVIALVATGIYSAWLHVPGPSSLFSTNYGRILSAKIMVFIGVLIIAGLNWKRVLPALATHKNILPVAEKWICRFNGLLPAEAALAVVVLALVAILTSLPPASAVIASGPIDMSRLSGDLTVHLRMESNRVGKEQSVVTLTDVRGQRILGARHVTLYLRSQEMDMGLETVEGLPLADGAYRADVLLTMAGRWLISVEVSPAEGDDFVAEFELSSTM